MRYLHFWRRRPEATFINVAMLAASKPDIVRDMQKGLFVVATISRKMWAMNVVDTAIDVWKPLDDRLRVVGPIPEDLGAEPELKEIVLAAIEAFSEAVPGSGVEIAPGANFTHVEAYDELHFAIEVEYVAQACAEWQNFG